MNALPPVPLTIEGASVLHQMMRIRWSAWRDLAETERDEIVTQAVSVLSQMEAGGKNGSAVFSLLGHKGDLMFTGVPSPFEATRYHSLIVEEPIPSSLAVTAFTDAGEVMGLRHRERPILGVQFHPESILTTYGPRILQNFLENRF